MAYPPTTQKEEKKEGMKEGKERQEGKEGKKEGMKEGKKERQLYTVSTKGRSSRCLYYNWRRPSVPPFLVITFRPSL